MKKLKFLLRPYWRLVKKIFSLSQASLIQPLRALPISSEIIGPPKRACHLTKDWALESSRHKGYKAVYAQVYASDRISRNQPQTIEKQIHWQLRSESERDLPAAFVAAIPEGRAWASPGKNIHSTAIIAPDDTVLSDVSLEFGKFGYRHSVFQQLKLPPVNYFPDTVAVLSSAKGHNYYRWMFDILPKIQLLQQGGFNLEEIDKFLVNGYKLPFQTETLLSLGIPHHKLIESHQYRHVKAAQLLVPSLPSIPGNPPQWACEFLRDQFLFGAIDPDAAIERIYISRAEAKHRRTIAEREISAFLDKLGFRTVILESMSVFEQARLFAGAKVVISPHGAGLTNLVFCQPGTKVIEFFSPNYVNPCYYNLSQQMGLEYHYFIGKGDRPRAGFDPHLVGENIVISTDTLTKALRLAGVGYSQKLERDFFYRKAPAFLQRNIAGYRQAAS